jgi:hypothetical protein
VALVIEQLGVSAASGASGASEASGVSGATLLCFCFWYRFGITVDL